MKPLKISFLIFCIIFISNSIATAKKLDWTTGYYALTAKTPYGSGRISSLSYYQIAFRSTLLNKLELSLGYTLTLSKTFGGEYGYGPDMGLVYFPLTSALSNNITLDTGSTFYHSELFRPFLECHFHQRQFQSIQTTYAGFSVGLGFEYWMWKNIGFRMLSKNVILRGPLSATATEVDVLVGLTYEY